MKRLTLGLALSIAVLSTGCTFLSKAKSALASPDTVVSLEIVGAIVDTTMNDASKLQVEGRITTAQWAKIAADYDAEQKIYHLAVLGVNAATTAAPSDLLAAMSAIVTDFKSSSQ